jgi:hypothetical protein
VNADGLFGCYADQSHPHPKTSHSQAACKASKYLEDIQFEASSYQRLQSHQQR